MIKTVWEACETVENILARNEDLRENRKTPYPPELCDSFAADERASIKMFSRISGIASGCVVAAAVIDRLLREEGLEGE